MKRLRDHVKTIQRAPVLPLRLSHLLSRRRFGIERKDRFLYFVSFLWLEAQTIVAGREAEVLRTIATEIRERSEIHTLGNLSEREAIVVKIAF